MYKINQLMKALILSGGKGTRLRPLTYTMAKQLVPVANRPILHYVVDHVVEAGIKDIGVIIAPETGDEIKKSLEDRKDWQVEFTYILQHEPLGLAHAVKVGKDFLGNEPFVLYLGDNLLQEGIKEASSQFLSGGADALIYLKEVENPSAFGVGILDSEGNIVKLVEKPKKPISNLALVGVYFFQPIIHEAIKRIKPSWRGELEITDAIQELLNKGRKVKSQILNGWWLDTGKKDDILTANTLVLDSYSEYKIDGKIKGNCQINGRVSIDKGTLVEDSIIRGPAMIGKNTKIKSSFIGPFTSIGNDCVIENSVIEHVVILESSIIENIDRLEDSLLGKRVKIIKDHQSPHKALRLMIGDDAEVKL